MNDLEERIRATLDQRARPSALRTMPPGTRRRIRSRQAGAAFVAFATAMAFSSVAFALFSTPSGVSRTAAGEDEIVVVQPPRGLDPSLYLHDVDPPSPGEWPDVTNGDLSGATYAGSGTSASTSCTFADNGTYSVKGRIIDKDGGYTEYTTRAGCWPR